MTDITPYIVLSKPQLGENIGSTARAMKNFGIEKLRLISPRDGWPNETAYAISAGADNVLNNIEVFDTLEKATQDISLLVATTARKRVVGTKSLDIFDAVEKTFEYSIKGGQVGFLFGPEQSGLSNDDVVQADFTVSIPLNKDFSSLNLSQAVLLICWEWNKIKMSNQLSDGLVEYSDGKEATVEQMSKDVTTFLMWTAEPHLESRHRMGFKAIVYLIIFTILVYFSMKKIWSRIETKV